MFVLQFSSVHVIKRFRKDVSWNIAKSLLKLNLLVQVIFDSSIFMHVEFDFKFQKIF